MISLEAFSDLLEALHAAPLHDNQWQRFLSLLCLHTQSQLAVFLCADNRLGVSCRAQGGRTPQDQVDVLAYNQRYARTDPFRSPCFSDPRPRIVQGDELLPNQGLLRTDLYRDLLQPRGYRYSTLMLLSLSLRRVEVITIWRSVDQGPMDDDSNHLLQLLFPHIQNALQIRQLFGVTQQRLAGAEAMANASSTATLLLTRDGRVLHSNDAAQSLLRQSSALTLHNGTLLPTQPRFKDPLRQLFIDAAAPISPLLKSGSAHALALPRGSGLQPLHLLATPLPPRHRGSSHADLVLFITDPDQVVSFPDDILRSLYNLTPAQTEVANGLLSGYSLEEIASLRRVSLGTVRQQLKAILQRTNTSRQSDLIRLLMALPSAPPQANSPAIPYLGDAIAG